MNIIHLYKLEGFRELQQQVPDIEKVSFINHRKIISLVQKWMNLRHDLFPTNRSYRLWQYIEFYFWSKQCVRYNDMFDTYILSDTWKYNYITHHIQDFSSPLDSDYGRFRHPSKTHSEIVGTVIFIVHYSRACGYKWQLLPRTQYCYY